MNHHNTDSTLIIIIIIITCICSLFSSCLSSLVGLYHSGLEFDLDFPFGEVGYVFMNDLWVITDVHDLYNADVGDNCLSEISIEEAKTECNENDNCNAFFAFDGTENAPESSPYGGQGNSRVCFWNGSTDEITSRYSEIAPVNPDYPQEYIGHAGIYIKANI